MRGFGTGLVGSTTWSGGTFEGGLSLPVFTALLITDAGMNYPRCIKLEFVLLWVPD